ncbi:MAG: hypothetical protein QNI91_08865 [Arenicellales bacterium]|nr:hypothetical protein [Arenicellales bacterium]
MRGFSLILLIVGLLFVGYLYQRGSNNVVYTNTGKPTTKHIEQQAKDILQQYQKKLDKQAEDQ